MLIILSILVVLNTRAGAPSAVPMAVMTGTFDTSLYVQRFTCDICDNDSLEVGQFGLRGQCYCSTMWCTGSTSENFLNWVLCFFFWVNSEQHYDFTVAD